MGGWSHEAFCTSLHGFARSAILVEPHFSLERERLMGGDVGAMAPFRGSMCGGPDCGAGVPARAADAGDAAMGDARPCSWCR